MTQPIRDRATFQALARQRPTRRGAITMRVDARDDGGPPRVAYAIGRHVGGAVARNRVRRRLRAAVHANEAALEAGSSYLFGAGREALSVAFDTLVTAIDELLRSEGR